MEATIYKGSPVRKDSRPGGGGGTKVPKGEGWRAKLD